MSHDLDISTAVRALRDSMYEALATEAVPVEVHEGGCLGFTLLSAYGPSYPGRAGFFESGLMHFEVFFGEMATQYPLTRHALSQGTLGRMQASKLPNNHFLCSWESMQVLPLHHPDPSVALHILKRLWWEVEARNLVYLKMRQGVSDQKLRAETPFILSQAPAMLLVGSTANN